MTPFQQFRLWLRRAPALQRVSALVGTALVLALAAYLVVPPSGSTGDDEALASGGPAVPQPDAAVGPGAPADSSGTGVQEPAPGAAPEPGGPADAGSAGTAEPVVGAPAGAAPAGSGSSGTDAGPAGTSTQSRAGTADGAAPAAPAARRAAAARSCPQGDAPGVTDTTIKVGIILTKLVGPAANELFGIATPEQQEGYWKRVLADVNAKGGAGCRTLVPTFHEANAADNNNLREVCLDVVESGAFAALDTQAYAQFPIVECYPRNKVPYFGGYFVSETIRARSYPYLFQFNSADQLHKDTIFALRDRGFFKKENGFTKLAFPYKTCDPKLIESMRSWLRQAGVGKSQVVEYDFGCPNGFASPSTIQQAVLTFQRAGATSLTYGNLVGDFGNFTRIAEQQRYRPRYGLPNDALLSVSKGSARPDPNNMAGALAIDQGRYGEETTPGSTPTAATKRCSAILGEDLYDLPLIAGKTCNMAWMFKAAVDGAPKMARTALAAGLQQAGSVEFSFPQGPNTFAGPRTTTGGQFWRTTRFTPSCSCWQVLDRTFRPAYR